MSLAWAHPVVREWFTAKFGTPTEPQVSGWPAIVAGRSTLISAPTGSGKTLAAFLACLDRLVRQAIDGTLADRTEVVYVSPLKALGNDVQKNLDGPLAEIMRLAVERGFTPTEIRTAVRTGDTLAPARRAMLRRPPHILVTTPESLYILLTAERSRANLRDVSTLIVDEIHAVADDKRGAHLMLSIERLEALTARPLLRIGLSATQKPIEVVAAYLGGSGRPLPDIVQVTPRRELDVAIECPAGELGAVASQELWNSVYDRVAALAAHHRSTLVFVNTRRLAERLTHHLGERIGADLVAAHHGSLSRRLRLDAERRLKAGELRVLVATASLELGIDIGSIDLVCQIGSPRSISAAVQRIGRAGHWRGAIPKGRLFPTTRDDLVECAALIAAIRTGDLDRLIIPDAPLDILAQQIVAITAVEEWQEDDLFSLVTRAWPYRDLSRSDFDDVLRMLSEGISARRGRYGAFVHRDRVNGRVRGRRGSRLVAITSGGAIPETGQYTVVAEPEGTVIGHVDEDFAVESMVGDIMLLGNTSWRIRGVSIAGRMSVEDARGAAPTIPFWRGEAPGRTAELSAHVSHLRREVERRTMVMRAGERAASTSAAADAITWLQGNCGVDRAGAEQIVDYLVAARAALGTLPTADTIIAERFFDEGGGMQLVIHAPLGARINKAWGLALRKRFCRSFNFELQASATDDGINIALAEQHSFPLADVFGFLRPATVRDVLEQASLDSPIFGTRWRWDASRSLALIRFRGGRKVPIHIQRLQSADLLAAVFPDVAACQENIEGPIEIPRHPLVREVMKDVLTEAMDIDGLTQVLERIADGTVRILAVDTPEPSVLAHEILNANPYAFLDDAPLEERRARAVQLRRTLPGGDQRDIGRLDPAAIASVRRQAWPDVRDADELHDLLLSLVLIPTGASCPGPLGARLSVDVPRWQPLFDTLARSRRGATVATVDATFWVASERRKAALALFPEARVHAPDVEAGELATTAQDARVLMLQGWMAHSGPTDAGELARLLHLSAADIHDALLRLEASGWALRGQFDGRPPVEAAFPDQWCERRLLARIHRETIGALRREIAPVTAADFMRWLLEWQHVAPGTQLHGAAGTLEVLCQLQGFEAPANSWEPHLLRRRVAGYDPADLDQLCLGGDIGWGRLSPHPATIERSTSGPRRVIPTSVAPITFFVREDATWMSRREPETDADRDLTLSPNARTVLAYLKASGASFFTDLVRATRHLASEVELALWELVAAGVVTADGFDSLRALVDPQRRSGQGRGRQQRPRHGAGRWALLPHDGGTDRFVVAESAARMLLRRYGVVFRDVLARESNVPAWRDVLMALRRLEDRGEIRGGRFVEGFVGEQFALPVAVESLRALRHRPAASDIVTVGASDPLNLVGILVPGERVPAVTGRTVSFQHGRALSPTDAISLATYACASTSPA
jgi:ATP-dependent Lhr-like helicase